MIGSTVTTTRRIRSDQSTVTRRAGRRAMPAIAKTTSCITVATNMMAPNLTRTSLRSAGTEAYTQGQGHAGPANELEESPSVVTEAARSRYRKGKAERYATNKDGSTSIPNAASPRVVAGSQPVRRAAKADQTNGRSRRGDPLGAGGVNETRVPKGRPRRWPYPHSGVCTSGGRGLLSSDGEESSTLDLRSAARFRRLAASAGSLVVWDSFKRASALRLDTLDLPPLRPQRLQAGNSTQK
jgi:hypothetical protein